MMILSTRLGHFACLLMTVVSLSPVLLNQSFAESSGSDQETGKWDIGHRTVRYRHASPEGSTFRGHPAITVEMDDDEADNFKSITLVKLDGAKNYSAAQKACQLLDPKDPFVLPFRKKVGLYDWLSGNFFSSVKNRELEAVWQRYKTSYPDVYANAARNSYSFLSLYAWVELKEGSNRDPELDSLFVVPFNHSDSYFASFHEISQNLEKEKALALEPFSYPKAWYLRTGELKSFIEEESTEEAKLLAKIAKGRKLFSGMSWKELNDLMIDERENKKSLEWHQTELAGLRSNQTLEFAKFREELEIRQKQIVHEYHRDLLLFAKGVPVICVRERTLSQD